MTVWSRLSRSFNHSLKTRPLMTNSLLYGSFWVSAELSGQSLEHYYAKGKHEHKMDYMALPRVFIVGAVLYAPSLSLWYRFVLDKYLVGTSKRVVITKVAVDQLVSSPILTALFYPLMNALEGQEDLLAELREKYWKTMALNQLFWVPAQTINFGFVPSHMRVAYVGAMSFIWINVLCWVKRQRMPDTKEP